MNAFGASNGRTAMVARERPARTRAVLATVVAGAWAMLGVVRAPAQQHVDAQNRVVETKLPPGAGERGGSGLAIKARKILTVPIEGGQFVDNAVLIVKDGKI